MTGVDLDTTGMKTIKYKVDIPEGLWSNEAEGEIQIYLMDPDGFSLGNYNYNNETLSFIWNRPFSDFETKLKLQVAEDDGVWTDYYYEDSKMDDFFTMSANSLSVYADRLNTNVKYSFQLIYEDEQSDVAEATFFRDTDGSLCMVLQYIEGKRDGDQGTDTMPPFQQPGIPGEGEPEPDEPDTPNEDGKDESNPSDGDEEETPKDETSKDEIPKDETSKDETSKDETTKSESPKNQTPNSKSVPRADTTASTAYVPPDLVETITNDETIINGVRLGKLRFQLKK